MIEWQGEGTVLGRRRHGENAAILTVFARDAGVMTGAVPGGAGTRRGPLLQPGNRLSLRWRARLSEQMGTFSVEPLLSRAGLMDDPDALAALNAVTALLAYALPERDPHPRLWDQTESLLDALPQGEWAEDYLRWELMLLDELGFGLTLDRCAVTGRAEGLAYVSPRTGHAVTEEGAGEWAARLLPLPRPLGGPTGGLAEALTVTGYFLNAWLAEGQIGKPLPAARARLVARLSRAA